MKKCICTVLAGALILGAAFAAPLTVNVGGSTSVSPLMEQFAAEYQKGNSNVKITINGTGSGDGIKNTGALYQIGMSSRDLSAAEKVTGLVESIVAIDGIAVIVNKANPVRNLTKEQIKNIYTGQITDWSQVGGTKGPIAVVSREEGSGTRGAFEELLGFQGKLLKGANESTSTGAIKAGIAGNPNAIGYISLGSVDATIKALSVDGVTASTANVLNNTYKIARPFIVMTKGKPSGEVKKFTDWMLSPAGQAIVKKSWIPVK